jgi:hypothetical protein
MDNLSLPLVAWVACGLLGWLILSRNPGKALFDDAALTTIATVLMASLVPLWGGPLFLLAVLLIPNKKGCLHCRRVMPQHESQCPHCLQNQEILDSQARVIRAHKQREDQERTELSGQFDKWELLALPLFFVTAPAVGYLAWRLLALLGDWRYAQLAQDPLALVPSSSMWVLPAIFLGITGSALPMYLVLRLALGKRYAAYQRYLALKAGPSERVSWIVLGLITLLCGAAIVLMLDYAMVAGPQELVINPFWGLGEKRYAYREIVAIRSSQQLEEAQWERPIYLLEFRSGEKWSNRYDIDERDQAQVAGFFAYLARRSGLEIEQVPAFVQSDLR